MERKVIVIGAMNYDVCLKLERLPEEGETNFADSVEYCSGGKGGNQAVQAAKLKVPTYMVGCVGTDESGNFLLDQLNSYGVHTEYVKRVRGNSGMSVAQSMYDGGIRASVVRGANEAVTRDVVDEIASVIAPGDIVVLQLEIPVDTTEYAVTVAKERGAYVILNAAPALPIDKETIRKVDLFIVNEVEAAFYTGNDITDKEIASGEIRAFHREYGTDCIFTLGKAGSVVCNSERDEFVPSKKVEAVESTGAGDSFIGGLCYALMNGMDLFTAASFATCCSAKTVCKTGGQPAMPTLEEVMELYQA